MAYFNILFNLLIRIFILKTPTIDFSTKTTVNTDDLGIFYTSLPREFELLTLALLKKKNEDGSTLYSSQEVYDWIERIVRKAHAYCFSNN